MFFGVKNTPKKLIHIIHKDSGCPTPLAKIVACENEKQFEIATANGN